MNEKNAKQNNMKAKGEREFLDKVSKTYVAGNSSQDNLIRELVVRTIKPFIKRGRALELGCSDGYMTQLLAQHVDQIDVVDGSKVFLKKGGRRGIKNANFIDSLFESFEPVEKYDYIFATYILEHVMDVDIVLNMIRRALKKKGLLYVVVPNANAMSRQLAFHMGLLPDLHSLTPNDLNHGHRRVYDRVLLDKELRKAGFAITSSGGIFLKPFADFQMDKLLDSGMIDSPQIEGLYRLGSQYPDLCGSLYSICTLNDVNHDALSRDKEQRAEYGSKR